MIQHEHNEYGIEFKINVNRIGEQLQLQYQNHIIIYNYSLYDTNTIGKFFAFPDKISFFEYLKDTYGIDAKEKKSTDHLYDNYIDNQCIDKSNKLIGISYLLVNRKVYNYMCEKPLIYINSARYSIDITKYQYFQRIRFFDKKIYNKISQKFCDTDDTDSTEDDKDKVNVDKIICAMKEITEDSTDDTDDTQEDIDDTDDTQEDNNSNIEKNIKEIIEEPRIILVNEYVKNKSNIKSSVSIPSQIDNKIPLSASYFLSSLNIDMSGMKEISRIDTSRANDILGTDTYFNVKYQLNLKNYDENYKIKREREKKVISEISEFLNEDPNIKNTHIKNHVWNT